MLLILENVLEYQSSKIKLEIYFSASYASNSSTPHSPSRKANTNTMPNSGYVTHGVTSMVDCYDVVSIQLQQEVYLRFC